MILVFVCSDISSILKNLTKYSWNIIDYCKWLCNPVTEYSYIFSETTKHMNKSLANDFDWMPRFQYLPFEIDNTTRPFRFDFDPIKQVHWSFIVLFYRIKKDGDGRLPLLCRLLSTNWQSNWEVSQCQKSFSNATKRPKSVDYFG